MIGIGSDFVRNIIWIFFCSGKKFLFKLFSFLELICRCLMICVWLWILGKFEIMFSNVVWKFDLLVFLWGVLKKKMVKVDISIEWYCLLCVFVVWL